MALLVFSFAWAVLLIGALASVAVLTSSYKQARRRGAAIWDELQAPIAAAVAVERARPSAQIVSIVPVRKPAVIQPTQFALAA